SGFGRSFHYHGSLHSNAYVKASYSTRMLWEVIYIFLMRRSTQRSGPRDARRRQIAEEVLNGLICEQLDPKMVQKQTFAADVLSSLTSFEPMMLWREKDIARKRSARFCLN